MNRRGFLASVFVASGGLFVPKWLRDYRGRSQVSIGVDLADPTEIPWIVSGYYSFPIDRSPPVHPMCRCTSLLRRSQ